jgi:ankyrin repeat protein
MKLIALALFVLVSSRTPLIQAIYDGEINEAYRLIDSGVDLNEKDATGKTALIYSIRDSDTGIALYLISKNADIEVSDPLGNTPLYWSIQSFETKVRRELIARGANVNALNLNGDSPVIASAQSYDEIAIKELYAAGANLDFKNKNGQSALMISYQLKDFFTLELLLELGAIPFSMKAGEFSYDIPMKKPDFRKAYYRYSDATGNNHLLKYIQMKNWSVVRGLIEFDFDFEARNYQGENALILLTKSNQIELVRSLVVDKKVYLDGWDVDQMTAIQYAKKLQHTEIYDLLKNAGAEE